MAHRHEVADRIWITRLVDAVRARTVDRPLLVAAAVFGTIPASLTVAFFALTPGAPPIRFTIAHLLAATVPFLGVPAIWYWDVRVFPQFVQQASDIAADPADVRRVANEYKRVFVEEYWWFALPWTALVTALIVLNVEFFETLGVTGLADPALWAYLLFAGWWGLVTGIGFHGAITATRTIRAVGDLPLEIDPLHPDGLGGLSSIGSLAIWTTMLISLGSLTLPLAFFLGSTGGYATLVSLAVGIYVVVIVVSFGYPTVYVNRRAQDIREDELERCRSNIRHLQAQSTDPASSDGERDEGASVDDVVRRLEIQRLRDEFNEYESVNLYPLSIGIIARLVSSILLPVFFVFFETFVGRLL